MAGEDVFTGVRVVELAQFVFVPGAGALMADFGAEVIKIEMTDAGDPYRTLSIGDGREQAEVNIALEQNNRGKKSIGIDAKSEQGREVLRKLVATADVFVTSVRPQALARLKLDVEQVRAWNPKVIYVRGNGFGFNGPDAGKPGFDSTAFWTRAGFATVLMHSEHTRPVRSRGALGDHAGATGVAYGIAAALYRRERTGQPSVVDISLLATGMWVLSADITAAQNPGYDSLLAERRAPRFPLIQTYRTRDGRWINLTFLHPDRHWAALCRAIGLEQYARDPRFATNDERARNGVECHRLIADSFAARDWAEWKPIMDQLDAPWELAQTIDELLVDPQAIANGYVVDTEMSNGKTYKLVSGPVAFDGRIPTAYRRAPKLGEHTLELLTELGYSAKEHDALRESGAIK